MTDPSYDDSNRPLGTAHYKVVAVGPAGVTSDASATSATVEPDTTPPVSRSRRVAAGRRISEYVGPIARHGDRRPRRARHRSRRGSTACAIWGPVSSSRRVLVLLGHPPACRRPAPDDGRRPRRRGQRARLRVPVDGRQPRADRSDQRHRLAGERHRDGALPAAGRRRGRVRPRPAAARRHASSPTRPRARTSTPGTPRYVAERRAHVRGEDVLGALPVAAGHRDARRDRRQRAAARADRAGRRVRLRGDRRGRPSPTARRTAPPARSPGPPAARAAATDARCRSTASTTSSASRTRTRSTSPPA